MGTVLYEASPWQAFLGSFGTIAFVVVLGILGIGFAILRKNQKNITRIFTGAVGAFLILVGCVFAALVLLSFSSGARTVALQLDNKTVAEDNCGDNGETCTRYVLSSTTQTNAYDFDVPQSVYQKVNVDTCYQFTYYPNNGLLGLWLNTNSYQRIDNITKIVVADSHACQ